MLARPHDQQRQKRRENHEECDRGRYMVNDRTWCLPKNSQQQRDHDRRTPRARKQRAIADPKVDLCKPELVLAACYVHVRSLSYIAIKSLARGDLVPYRLRPTNEVSISLADGR